MNNEADFKDAFINSAKKQGGYAFRIAMSMVSGLPDMHCAMPNHAPVLLEAKYIKGLSLDKPFKRKIKYTKLQSELLRSTNKVNPARPTAYGLIGLDFGKDKYAMIYNPLTEVVTDLDLYRGWGREKIDSNGFIDVFSLFYAVVPKLELHVRQADHEIVIGASRITKL